MRRGEQGMVEDQVEFGTGAPRERNVRLDRVNARQHRERSILLFRRARREGSASCTRKNVARANYGLLRQIVARVASNFARCESLYSVQPSIDAHSITRSRLSTCEIKPRTYRARACARARDRLWKGTRPLEFDSRDPVTGSCRRDISSDGKWSGVTP